MIPENATKPIDGRTKAARALVEADMPLPAKEREVAKLAAFGLTNREISEKLHLSLSMVKQAIRIVTEKSGMSRADFAAIL